MANSKTTNPLVFDTAGATSALGRRAFIKAMYWDNPGAAGHQCILKDGNGGNLVFQRTAIAQYNGGDTVHFDKPLPAQDLYVDTLTSGTLVVYEA
jgi:hypothetical protein